jgi:hypothetical protein
MRSIGSRFAALAIVGAIAAVSMGASSPPSPPTARTIEAPDSVRSSLQMDTAIVVHAVDVSSIAIELSAPGVSEVISSVMPLTPSARVVDVRAFRRDSVAQPSRLSQLEHTRSTASLRHRSNRHRSSHGARSSRNLGNRSSVRMARAGRRTPGLS